MSDASNEDESTDPRIEAAPRGEPNFGRKRSVGNPVVRGTGTVNSPAQTDV